MKILIVPMAAAAPTAGPFSRAMAIAIEAQKRGHQVAFCAAEEMNYKAVDGIKNYFAPIPKLFGVIPFSIAKRVLPIIQKLKIQEKKEVKSFEQVLFISGAITGDFFSRDVNWIRKASNEFKPDVIFAEFRPAAIVAAKLDNTKVVTDYSYPTQKAYASSPEYCENVKHFLSENRLPEIESVLDIFEWADTKVVASSYSLEPIDGENIHFVGPIIPVPEPGNPTGVKNVIFYLGTGTISYDKTVKIAIDTFKDSNYQVYVAVPPRKKYPALKNIHIQERFDFRKLMPDCVAFINHGGQNSIMTGLIYGVPQIIFPGKVFERKYNAHSIKNIGAGLQCSESDFNSEAISTIIRKFTSELAYQNNSERIGKELLKLGGVSQVVDVLEGLSK
jgi:UDP:flavonoid glycosyltransferase YjiC (YdhE family)